jgi:hypothetical protein
MTLPPQSIQPNPGDLLAGWLCSLKLPTKTERGTPSRATQTSPYPCLNHPATNTNPVNELNELSTGAASPPQPSLNGSRNSPDSTRPLSGHSTTQPITTATPNSLCTTEPSRPTSRCRCCGHRAELLRHGHICPSCLLLAEAELSLRQNYSIPASAWLLPRWSVGGYGGPGCE